MVIRNNLIVVAVLLGFSGAAFGQEGDAPPKDDGGKAKAEAAKAKAEAVSATMGAWAKAAGDESDSVKSVYEKVVGKRWRGFAPGKEKYVLVMTADEYVATNGFVAAADKQEADGQAWLADARKVNLTGAGLHETASKAYAAGQYAAAAAAYADAEAEYAVAAIWYEFSYQCFVAEAAACVCADALMDLYPNLN